jgi:hypothetical protein
MPPRDSGLGTRDSGRGRVRFVLVLAVIAAGVWLAWPSKPGPRAPSVTERAKANGAANPQDLSARVIGSGDLPPEGTRSLFDHLVAQNDALPYPFEKLVALVQRLDPQNRAPVALMIPKGRSLLKAQADFAHPRVLVGADFDSPDSDTVLGLAARGQLFLGFVEDAAEIEVISYNEAAGRYEFQLVRDYSATGARRIVYARRAVCTTCHQGAAPIFPQRPWNETNGQPEISRQIVAARGNDEPYLGVPALNPLGVPERFDQLTDTANFIPVTQRIWLDGCGGAVPGAVEVGSPPTDVEADASTDCRRLLLKLALRYASNPGEFAVDGKDAATLRQMQSAQWPDVGIGVPESDLKNRDPLAETRGVRGFLRTLFASKTAPAIGAKSNEDLDAFDRLPKLPADLDPLSPRPPKRVLRPTDIDGVFGLAAMFTAADLKLLEQHAGYSWDKAEAAVDALPESFFGAAPFSRVKTLQALLGGKRSYCCLDTSEMSPPSAVGVPPLALAADSKLKSFEQFCFTCHRGNPSKRLDFMNGPDEAAVAKSIADKGEIRDVLDWQRYKGTAKEHTLMPPADSPQRALLTEALAKDPQLLEKMRGQVHGLFDF